jgi:radical SAM superfamily enzyme YgiQ (UPF0313 family)
MDISGLGSVAARVPPYWEVSHVDEEAEDIDWTGQPDVVAITFHTPSAYRAYGLAARFRLRGACVVMGGPHVTLLPEEAGQHADVIFVGEAEGLWEEFLNGFVTGTYRRVYRQAGPTSLDGAPMAHSKMTNFWTRQPRAVASSCSWALSRFPSRVCKR